MRWPWMRSGRTVEPPRAVSLKRAELETAKEILAEVFHARPEDVEEMIQQRLEERSLAYEQGPFDEDGLWPEAFCLSGE
jgi:hypothetical protein